MAELLEDFSPHLNSYGIRLTIETGTNLSGSSALTLKMKRPNGTLVERELDTAAMLELAQGRIIVDFIEGDFPVVGTYSLQIFDTSPGRFIPSDIVKFKVRANLA